MNLPNKITIGRILLIPVFMITYIEGYEMLATIIFCIAAFTDGLDGYLARSRNEITTFGKFMDPLADKLLTSSALILLVEHGKASAWIVSLIIAREFFITGFRTIAVSEGITIAASKLGKIKTVSQILAIILLLSNNLNNIIPFKLDIYMLYIALFFTLLSGIDYVKKNKMVLKEGNKN